MRNTHKNVVVGIVGFGRFGQLVARFLSKEFAVVVYSKLLPKKLPQNIRIRFGTLRDISQSQIVIFCVPIRNFKESIKEVSPFLKKGTLVVDVCSVKKHPVEVMKRYLPRDVDILGTHPLFGPNSVQHGLKGLCIVLSPVRISKTRLATVKHWLKKKKLRLITMLPDKHDRLMAKTHVMAHLIGRALHKINAKKTPIETPTFRKLLEAEEMVSRDTRELSLDIYRFNPYARSACRKFKKAFSKLAQSWDQKS